MIDNNAWGSMILKSAIAILLLCTSFCTVAEIEADRGLMDLRDWDFEKDGPVNLSGDYEFYWHKLFKTQDLYVNSEKDTHYQRVPGTWNGRTIDDQELGGDGYATYRLNILVSQVQPYALKMPDVGTSYRLLVDGKTLLTVGNPGTSKQTSTPKYYPAVVEFKPSSNRIELIFQVSNFNHRLGGLWLPIEFGTPAQIRSLRENQLARDLVLFGAIFIIGLYNLALFALRRENKSSLYLGVFCLVLALRLLLVGDRYMTRLFPELPFEWYVTIEYLAWYLAVPAFVAFLRSVFPREIYYYAAAGTTASFCIGAIIVLFMPVSIFSFTAPVFQVLTVAALIYGAAGLLLATYRNREGSRVLLFAYIFLFYTIVSDILVNAGLINNVLLLDIGLFIFIFCQSILISYRFTQSFNTIARQGAQLRAANIRLQTQEKLRKEAELESESLQSKIAQTEKIETISLLADEVADDLNNILSSTVVYPELALQEVTPEQPLYKPLEMTRLSGLRAAAIIQDILTLARRGSVKRDIVNLNSLVTRYLNSIEHQLMLSDEKHVEICTALDESLNNIEVSQTHIEKLLKNLISNAIFTAADNANLLVSTHNESCNNKRLFYGEIKAGNYVVLSVEDPDRVINHDELEKMFEPDRHSDPHNRISMAVILGVVKDHNGGIDIMTHPGEGTRLDLYFPATERNIDTTGEANVPTNIAGNGEKILLIDDQQDLLTAILSRLNYRVSHSSGVASAMDLAGQNHYDLVLVDMQLAGGQDAVHIIMALNQLDPNLKIILLDGSPLNNSIAEELSNHMVIRKPFTLQSVSHAIAATLG